jgi:hypothetical protein
MDIDIMIVVNHVQRFEYSCIPSAVEMVLKLSGLVGQEYYELQTAWRPDTNLDFRAYNGSVFEGLSFQRQFGIPPSPQFPINELFEMIDRELSLNHFVIISLAVNGGWHMYVIFEKLADDYVAFTKTVLNGHQTLLISNVKEIVRQMEGTDILIYQ